VKARGSLSACCGERKKGHKVARLSFEDFDLPPTASRRGFTANFIGLSLVARTQGDEINVLVGYGEHLRGVGDRDSQRKAQAPGMTRIFKEEQCPTTTHIIRRQELHKCRHVGVRMRIPGD
jgi:hypothetical protein